jgi:hypothetical protein
MAKLPFLHFPETWHCCSSIVGAPDHDAAVEG